MKPQANVDSAQALKVAQKVARQAGDILQQGFRQGASVQKKGAVDLLTEYDLRSEQLVREALSKEFPGHHIVGEEESDERCKQEAATWSKPVWFVDPLDGTTNFAHGHPSYSVSIALYAQGEPMVGVVHAPALGVTWTAAKGHGCWRNEQRCSVSRCTELNDALCATGFAYDRRTISDNNLREFSAFVMKCQGVRRCGSAAMDLAMVADGTYDLYWERRLQCWDIAAGACLVREAGGTLSSYEGAPYDAFSGELVATNGHLHAEVLDTLAEVQGR